MRRAPNNTPTGRRRARVRRMQRLLACVFAGALGAIAASTIVFMGGVSADARAGQRHAAVLDLRDAPTTSPATRFLRSRSPRYQPPARFSPSLERTPAAQTRLAIERSAPPQPRIILIIDDMGVDRNAFDRVMDLPGPLTLSFLPYALGVDAMAATAHARGDAVMLHLPMEPLGRADPGPNALLQAMSMEQLELALDWNLTRFDGFSAVNNHMGSRLTRDAAAMEHVLQRLKRRGLLFVDSLTTGESTGLEVGARIGAPVVARDIFLDAEPGRAAVARNLERLETIARERGLAIAIGHPRADTLDMLGPWLTSAPARGFELVTIETLVGAASAAMTAAAGSDAQQL